MLGFAFHPPACALLFPEKAAAIISTCLLSQWLLVFANLREAEE
jgi:hypothetical protein